MSGQVQCTYKEPDRIRQRRRGWSTSLSRAYTQYCKYRYPIKKKMKKKNTGRHNTEDCLKSVFLFFYF